MPVGVEVAVIVSIGVAVIEPVGLAVVVPVEVVVAVGVLEGVGVSVGCRPGEVGDTPMGRTQESPAPRLKSAAKNRSSFRIFKKAPLGVSPG